MCGRSRMAMRVVIGQFFARAHFVGHAAKGEEIEVEDEDDVRSDAGDQVAHVVIEAPPNGRNADHDGDADHDSEHSQAGTQLVAADRVRRHMDDFAEFRSYAS